MSEPTCTSTDHQRAGETWGAQAAALGRVTMTLGLFRLGLVALAVWVIVSLLNQPPWWGWLLLGILAAGFLAIGLLQQIREDRRLRAKALADWHAEGARRCKGESLGKPGRGRDGSDQLTGWHPFARDLDVCGPGGLIQRLNTGLSRTGYATLCKWCLEPEAAPAVAEARPRIAALQERLALRADIGIQAQVRGAGGLDGGVNDRQVVDDAAGLTAPPAWLPAAAWVMRLAAVMIMVALAMKSGAAGLWLGGLVAAVIGFPLDAWVAAQLGKAGDPIKLARAATAWREAMQALLREAGDDPHLSAWRKQAEAAIAGCTDLASWTEARVRRGNPMWQGLSAILQAQSFAWRKPLPVEAMRQWTAFLAEIEAVACLATWAAERGGVMPVEAPEHTIIDAEDLAHPLIPAEVRVGNDIFLQQHQVFLVTGANASGKSTFLRTLALTQVLARLGLPVAAKRCAIRFLRLATVMRVHDDLLAGRSRFQAEVATLKSSLDLATEAAPTMLILDEILAGTNSHERHLGTEAILRHVAGKTDLVVITTHDLALAELAEAADTPADRFVLAHFADDAGSEDLAFDYRIRDGIVTSTNALKVMKTAGLPV